MGRRPLYQYNASSFPPLDAVAPDPPASHGLQGPTRKNAPRLLAGTVDYPLEPPRDRERSVAGEDEDEDGTAD